MSWDFSFGAVMLQFINDLHGTDFWCSGDGAARECCPDQIQNIKFRAEFSDDCGDKMENSRIRFDVKMSGNFYSAWNTDMI